MKKSHLRLPTSDGEIHVVNFSVAPQGGQESRVVLFSHGFLVPGFESRRMFIDIAERLADNQISCVLFDYRGSGYSDKHFDEMTIQSEIEDLNVVLDYVLSLLVPNGKVALWGQSLGTVIAAEVAAKRSRDLCALVSWCLSAELHRRWNERYGDELRNSGFIHLPSGFMIRKQLLESTEKIDTYASLRLANIPKLFVVGTEDNMTPSDLTEKAIAESNVNTDVYNIEGGNHGFKNQPKQYEEAIKKTFNWLNNHLA